MDRLVRVLVTQPGGRVILDDKHKDYRPGELYESREEVLENRTTITLFYRHELDSPGLQPL